MKNIEELREKRDKLYAMIADASAAEADVLCEEVWKVEEDIENIENPPKPPLSIEEFEREYGVEREYIRFHDEYGDAAAPWYDYRDYHYQNYLSRHEKGWRFSC